MTTTYTAKDLKAGYVVHHENIDYDLDLFYSETLAPYCFVVEFNGQHYSFKTLPGAQNKYEKLKAKMALWQEYGRD